MTDNLNILFTSVGRRVALLREFRRAANDLGIRLNIHAADCQALAPGLQEADQAALVPPIGSNEYCPTLLDYCRHDDIDALIPLIDPELQPLSERREEFERIGTRAIVSAPEVMRVCLDKVLTAEFLAAHEFRTPEILTEDELSAVTFPLFMKPRQGSSGVQAEKVSSAGELAYFRQTRPGCIIQEFIEGTEHTVDVFAGFDGRPRCAVPRRRYEVRAGEVSKAQAVRHERIMNEACRLVEELGGCMGMITIQCFLTPGDEVVFIEINPRFGGGVPLSIRAGADSPRWVLELLMGREPAISMNGWTDGLFMLRYDEGVFVMPQDLPGK